MTKITKEQAQKWANALRSKKYSQAFGALQNPGGFCCLGVACVVFIPKDQLQMRESGFLDGGVPSGLNQPAAPKWLQEINDDFINRTSTAKTARTLDGEWFDTAAQSLSSLNDGGYTFDEIADLIELVYVHDALPYVDAEVVEEG